MAKVFYISHPQVQIDPSIPVPQWRLSDLGRQRMEKLAGSPFASKLTRIISSAERKALETAEILANERNLIPEVIEALHENDRSATGFLPPPEFEAVADQFFSRPEESIRGWERAIDAQNRVIQHVRTVLETTAIKDVIAFCGHGAVGTLLYCHLNGLPINRTFDQNGGGNFYTFSWPCTEGFIGWQPIERLTDLD